MLGQMIGEGRVFKKNIHVKQLNHGGIWGGKFYPLDKAHPLKITVAKKVYS